MIEFPTLETDRLVLRALRDDDLDQLILMLNNENVSKQVLSIAYPFTMKHAQERLQSILEGYTKREMFVFSIALRENDLVIGQIGLHPHVKHNHAEIGYVLGEPYWGKGFMTEAIHKVLEYGLKDRKFHKIIATHYIDNPASGRCMAKAGMNLEGELFEHYKTSEGYKSVRQYGITITQYQNI